MTKLLFFLEFLLSVRSFYICEVSSFSPQPADSGVPVPVPSGGYQIGTEQLCSMTRDRNFSALQEHGGASL